ncbi:MAG: fatty acid desaturase [Verrucomicrobia bacterium]|nr:fatty acid desaturase [Verrucomicrobiota bacterium]
MDSTISFRDDANISWYRIPVDRQLMKTLMRRSDWQGLRQALGHLGLFALTGTLAYQAFLQVSTATWYWSVPLLLAALFAHGTVGSFTGGTACHELSHGTPFKNHKCNNFFLRVFAFLSYWDHIWFEPSHIKHHEVTVHRDYDGEVVLPQRFTFKDWKFWLGLFAWNPLNTWNVYKAWFQKARGRLASDWDRHVMPENNLALRVKHRNWARFLLLGHLALAITFVATGHWFLIVLVNFGSHYCGWLGWLTGTPQHYGMSFNVPDHRLCCRTYTCGWLPSFLYWNMNYHIEHHMFPLVPFFNLPKLREAVKHDMPPAPHGLHATWKEILAIHRRTQQDPDYCYAPPLPGTTGERASNDLLRREAASIA